MKHIPFINSYATLSLSPPAFHYVEHLPENTGAVFRQITLVIRGRQKHSKCFLMKKIAFLENIFWKNLLRRGIFRGSLGFLLGEGMLFPHRDIMHNEIKTALA